MKKSVLVFFLFSTLSSLAQKKPLDHSVYDGWQSIGQKMISPNGRWIVYSVDAQEGDKQLVIESSAPGYKKIVERGTDAEITADSRFLVFRIQPFYKDTREAKIKKKKADEMPKDTLAVIELGRDSLWKKPGLKSFSVPEKGDAWLVYQLEKETDTSARGKTVSADRRRGDSLSLVIDSLTGVINKLSTGKKKKNRDEWDTGSVADRYLDLHRSEDDAGPEDEGLADDADPEEPAAGGDQGTELVLRRLEGGRELVFRNVSAYLLNELGTRLVFRQAPLSKDSLAKTAVVLHELQSGSTDTISYGGNDFRNFVFSEDGKQLAFVAERDARPRELLKFYKLWYYQVGDDSARMLVDKSCVGMKVGMTVSEFGRLQFSKSGRRLFFPAAYIKPAKDTNLVAMDLSTLDIWHYKDDYLQTVQLFRLNNDLQQNFLAVYDFEKGEAQQLGNRELPTVYINGDGDADYLTAVTDYGKRIESQWTGNTKKDIYQVFVPSGEAKLIKNDMFGVMSPSYISTTGKYVLWYDYAEKNYFLFTGDSTVNLTAEIKTKLYSEDHDSPSEPNPYGVMGWHEGDSAVYISDRYDVWKINLAGKRSISSLTRNLGRPAKTSWYPLVRDVNKKSYAATDKVLFRRFNTVNKKSSIAIVPMNGSAILAIGKEEPVAIPTFITRKQVSDSGAFLITKESYMRSPDLYYIDDRASAEMSNNMLIGRRLSAINPQQKEYNWGTAELYKWKTFSGASSEGILYKPEDFSPAGKYPVIFYFYEKLSDGLYNYIPPAPTPSRLNISFFVSRGYIVFAPNISYSIGHPAQSAYDYIVSAAKDLSKYSWVDTANLAIQGQSWGGIQVAQLITMTDIFKAAWAGAPVANMTSAYGGIRWESGVTRQFQYEFTQSRLGKNLWEAPELYIENSPLFHLPKVNTPLVIMANDADGAVPWYQGIELFTAMRRLNKQVWMLNYNGEAHNLVQRRNRKDIQIREQQYFDWLLKGAKPSKWITDGVPAVMKGRDWGLELTADEED